MSAQETLGADFPAQTTLFGLPVDSIQFTISGLNKRKDAVNARPLHQDEVGWAIIGYRVTETAAKQSKNAGHVIRKHVLEAQELHLLTDAQAEELTKVLFK